MDGQPNFRDLGGYRTTDGRVVKERLLYRSGELSRLSDRDVQRLQELGVRTVVDFRATEEEAVRGKDRLPPEVEYVPLRVAPGDLGEVLLHAIQTGDMTRIPDNVLADANRAIIARATEQYSALLQMIARPENLPLVFHCTHGKDRAGVASAIILMALGVSLADARRDYLLSNTFRGEQNERELGKLRGMAAARQGVAPEEVDLSKLESVFYVQPSDFAAMLAEIDGRHGSFDTYLETGLGLRQPDRERLENLLTR